MSPSKPERRSRSNAGLGERRASGTTAGTDERSARFDQIVTDTGAGVNLIQFSIL